MSAPNPYLGTDEDFDPNLHWGAFPGPIETRTFTGESVQGFDPSGEGFFGWSRGEESIQGVIDSKRLRGFMRWALGYCNMETEEPFRLQRTNPICHARMTNLVCDGVAHRGFNPVRKNAPEGSTNSGLKIGRNTDANGVVAVTEAGINSTPHAFPFYAGYEKELVTLRFSPAPYRFLHDDGGDSNRREYHRNTIIDTEPRTEVLTLSGHQIIYAEGTGNVLPTTNPEGSASPADLGQVLVRPDLKIVWHSVPEKFLSKNNTPGQLWPEKILLGLGKLNKGTGSTGDGTWLGYRMGTLQLVGVRFVRHPWALAAGAVGTGVVPTSLRESIFNYDVEFLFSHFDPTKGYTNALQIANAKTYGWNNHPWRGNPTGGKLAGTDLNAGRWFFATYSGNLVNVGEPTGDRGIYEYYDFDKLFTSVWAA